MYDEEESALNCRLSNILYKAGLLSSKLILDTEEYDLQNLGSFSNSEVKQIYKFASKREMPRIFTGAELGEGENCRWGHLTSGCPQLDSLLGGGILTRGITELSGHSGCGKTQLCLQLSITSQLSPSNGGLCAGAAFICTEDKFPSVRLNQLLKTFPLAKKFPEIKFGNNIFVEHISDAAELLQCVEHRLPQLVNQHAIRLVVIDSVAAVFRADYTSSDMIQRARDMRLLAAHLYHLANIHNIVVVCVNQVSDVRKDELSETVPALGLAWANLVTCRLQMFRQNERRHLNVIFAPHIPQGSCMYKITEAGVVGIS